MALPYTSSFDETIGFSETECQLTLTANNVQTYTLPGDNTKRFTVLFSFNSNSNVFIGLNATPAAPASNTNTTVPFVEFKPNKRYAQGGDVLSFVTPDATVYMGISVRSIPN